MAERFVLGLLLGVLAAETAADSERVPEPVIISGTDGVCYIRSIPGDVLGETGETTVFKVGEARDRLVDSYDWYSYSVYPYCYAKSESGIAIVRINPWPEGQEATAEQFAIGFYMDGSLIREYSTLEISITPDNVRRSHSHFRVFREIRGIFYDPRGFEYFWAITVDGRNLYFDVESGDVISSKLVESG